MKAAKGETNVNISLANSKRDGLLHTPHDQAISEEGSSSQPLAAVSGSDQEKLLNSSNRWSSCSSQGTSNITFSPTKLCHSDQCSQEELISNTTSGTVTDGMDDSSYAEDHDNSSVGLSDLSFYYTAHDGTLTSSHTSGHLMNHSTTDGHSGSYPADTFSCDTDGESDDTLCDEIGIDSKTSDGSSDERKVSNDMELRVGENSHKVGLAKPNRHSSDFTKKLGYVKICHRNKRREMSMNSSVNRHSVCSESRPVYRSFNSHNGSVSTRCSSLTSLPSSLRSCQPPLLFNLGNLSDVYNRSGDTNWQMAGYQHRVVYAREGGAKKETIQGVLWPLRRSVSTSPTHTFFAWEEVRLCNNTHTHKVINQVDRSHGCQYFSIKLYSFPESSSIVRFISSCGKSM